MSYSAARQSLLIIHGSPRDRAAARAAGVRVDLAYGGRGLKGAMKAADRSGARFALVLGERDLDAGTVGVKNLGDGSQTDVALDQVGQRVAELVRG